MTTSNFDRLSADEPPFSDGDTADDNATEQLINLPQFKNDSREIITMRHPSGHIVGKVRKGSLVHRVMVANGYRVVKQ